MDSAKPFALKPNRTTVKATTRRLREKGPPCPQAEKRSSSNFCERKKEPILDSSLVFPELFEKTALVEFLKQRKIDKTLWRHVLRPRLLLGHFIQDKFYPLEGGRRDFLHSLRVEGIGIVQNFFVVHPQIFF